jgi:diaminopimelate decarboxylase
VKINWGGLFEKLGTTPDKVAELRKERMINAMSQLRWHGLIVQRGGNIHKVNSHETARRHRANKLARQARRRNRD